MLVCRENFCSFCFVRGGSANVCPTVGTHTSTHTPTHTGQRRIGEEIPFAKRKFGIISLLRVCREHTGDNKAWPAAVGAELTPSSCVCWLPQSESDCSSKRGGGCGGGRSPLSGIPGEDPTSSTLLCPDFLLSCFWFCPGSKCAAVCLGLFFLKTFLICYIAEVLGKKK